MFIIYLFFTLHTLYLLDGLWIIIKKKKIYFVCKKKSIYVLRKNKNPLSYFSAITITIMAKSSSWKIVLFSNTQHSVTHITIYREWGRFATQFFFYYIPPHSNTNIHPYPNNTNSKPLFFVRDRQFKTVWFYDIR